jgi:hypothetical protein
VSRQLSLDIIKLFKEKFEFNCISLLLESYQLVYDSGRKMADYSENDITAQLIGLMKSNPKRKDLEISIQRENYLDSEQTYEGLVSADESPRIDIKYSSWNTKEEYEYFMEAKNLAEINWQKNNQVVIDAGKLHKRYIDTGIQNFLNGRYKNGCLIGYVLQGDTQKIIEKINSVLKKNKRDKEILIKHDQYQPAFCYVSSHSKTHITELKHFMLNFCN